MKAHGPVWRCCAGVWDGMGLAEEPIWICKPWLPPRLNFSGTALPTWTTLPSSSRTILALHNV
jgi:hypothetical protein